MAFTPAVEDHQDSNLSVSPACTESLTRLVTSWLESTWLLGGAAAEHQGSEADAEEGKGGRFRHGGN